MRVLFITQVVDRTDDNLGAVHGWIEALAHQVDGVHVLALRTGVVRLPANVVVHSLGKDEGNGKAGQLRVFNSVVGGLALRRQVDVFFPHMVPRYALLVAPYRALFRIPTVLWYAHNSADFKLRSAAPFVDRFVTVTRDSFPLDSSRCRVVGHGVDTELFKPDPALDASRRGDKVRVLSLGRISPRKELDTLISAADLLVNRWQRRDVEFYIAGAPLAPADHEYYARLKERVRELRLQGTVQFLGGIPHSQTVQQLQSCDYFVNMHVEGGLGKAVLEAMSCARPAFVSTPTYYEQFPDLRADFLFAPRDHEALASQIRKALELAPADRQAVGQELRDWVATKHDVRRQMARITEVFQEAIGGRSSASV